MSFPLFICMSIFSNSIIIQWAAFCHGFCCSADKHQQDIPQILFDVNTILALLMNFFFLENFIDEDSREGYKGYKVHTSQNVTDCLLNYKNIAQAQVAYTVYYTYNSFTNVPVHFLKKKVKVSENEMKEINS